MKVLGLDVCGSACAAAVINGDTVLVRLSEPMARGHVERLASMVSEVLDIAGLAPNDLNGIAVTTGPGSFTGARLGVSFARGLALSAEIPAVGVSLFEALAQQASDGPLVVALDGKRGDIFVQNFQDCAALAPPTAHPAETAWQSVPDTAFQVIGSACDAMVTDETKARATVLEAAIIEPEIIARIGAAKLSAGDASPPAPLYLRAADAKPQAVVSL